MQCPKCNHLFSVHGNRAAPVREKILALLKEDSLTAREIADRLGMTVKSVSNKLDKYEVIGAVKRNGHKTEIRPAGFRPPAEHSNTLWTQAPGWSPDRNKAKHADS